MKQIIWSSDALLDETAREYYQNFKREELDDDAMFNYDYFANLRIFRNNAIISQLIIVNV